MVYFIEHWFPNFIFVLDHLKVVDGLSRQLNDFSVCYCNSSNAAL